MFRSKRPLISSQCCALRVLASGSELLADRTARSFCRMRSVFGFTLIELMVTLAVLAILLSLAVPGFQSFVQNSRATTLANQLTSSIHLARSEAVRRGMVVSVCADVWTDGWRVEIGSDCDATGDNILRTWEARPTGSVIQSGGTDSVSFEATGARADASGDLVAFSVWVVNCRGERARSLRVAPNGSVGVAREDCP